MNWKKAIRIIGFWIILTGYIIYLITFTIAYFDDTKQVIVDIDAYGEANFEFIVALITLPCVIYFIGWYLKNERKKRKESKNRSIERKF